MLNNSTRLLQRCVYAALLLFLLVVAFGGCSEQRKAFKRHGVDRHQPKFEPGK